MKKYLMDRISVVDKYYSLWYNYLVHSSDDTKTRKDICYEKNYCISPRFNHDAFHADRNNKRGSLGWHKRLRFP